MLFSVPYFTPWVLSFVDISLKHLTNGSVVKLTVDSKGKVNLIDEPVNLATDSAPIHFEAEMQLKQQMGFSTTPQPSRSVEIADYIERLGKLYGHCLTTAVEMPAAIQLESTAVKDIATTMFIQTVRHFDL